MAQKKLTKKTLMKSFHHWYYGNLTCFPQEHMQTFGYLTSMLPIVEELHGNKEGQTCSMQIYTAFFNTEPQLGALIVDITAGLEEACASGSEEVDDETINGLCAGLMGPVTGIGDSPVVGTLIPAILEIAPGLPTGGSPVGAIFYTVVWNLLAYLGMKLTYFRGYELDDKAAEFLVGTQGQAIRKAVSIVGGTVVGGVAATWVSVQTPFQPGSAKSPCLVLQDKLNAVYPGFLTALFIVFCQWLMAKKNISPIKAMLLLAVIAFVGVPAGFFDPSLSY